jgi:hypothetical protein
MTGPRRIQLSRKRGWRLPEGAASVGRPSRWGNMFKVGGLIEEPGPWNSPAIPREGGLPLGFYPGRDITGFDYTYEIRRVRDRADAVALFRAYIRFNDDVWSLEGIRYALRGKTLACWGPLPAEGEPDICHGAVLLEIANAEESS